MTEQPTPTPEPKPKAASAKPKATEYTPLEAPPKPRPNRKGPVQYKPFGT